MLRSKLVLVLLAVCVLVACEERPRPDDPVRRQVLALEMARMAFSGESFEQMMDQAVDVAMTVVAAGLAQELGRELTHSEHVKLQDMMGRVFKEVYPRHMWEEALAPIFMKHLTAQDMEDLLKFYRTPLGAKLLVVNTKMMTDGAKAGEEVVKKKQEEFTRQVEVEFIKTFAE